MALTAVNPLTAVYFVVLTAGLGDAVTGWPAGARFAGGVVGYLVVLGYAGRLALTS